MRAVRKLSVGRRKGMVLASEKNADLNALVLGRSLLNGGTEKQSILITRALDEIGSGELVCLHADTDAGMEELAAEQGITVRFLDGTLLEKILWLQRHVRANEINLIVATLPVTNLVGGIVGLCSDTEVLGGFRTSEEQRFGRIFAMGILHRFAFLGTIANSFSGRDFLVRKGFDPETVFVLPNAVANVPSEVRKHEYSSPIVRLVTVARLVWHKRHELAIRAFAHARARSEAAGIELRYDLVGYGPERTQIQDVIDNLGLENDVQILDRGTDITDVLSEADIYLCTSMQEGMPNSVMEAMSFGLPVVSTVAGDTSVLVRDGETGFLVESDNPSNIAEYLSILAHDAGRRRQMGQNALRLIERHYTMEELQFRLEQILCRV